MPITRSSADLAAIVAEAVEAARPAADTAGVEIVLAAPGELVFLRPDGGVGLKFPVLRSAAMVLGPADRHPGAHRLIGGVARSATEHHELCVGNLDSMSTDTKGLMDAGLDLAEAAWLTAAPEHGWGDVDCYVIHQVSSIHTRSLCERLGIDPSRVPLTFPTLGNVGPASVPITLARQVETLSAGDRVLCMGIGSGLNTSFTEIRW